MDETDWGGRAVHLRVSERGCSTRWRRTCAMTRGARFRDGSARVTAATFWAPCRRDACPASCRRQ
eukprot:4960647-Pleurochrysis_carterae.AAC.9